MLLRAGHMEIEFNSIFCADLKDEFEEAGRDKNNFTLKDFINNDVSRAFAFGYCSKNWKKDLWFPISIRKELRHLYETAQKYQSQLEWVNSSYTLPEKVTVEKYIEYCKYVLETMFFDNDEDLLKVAMILGLSLNNET